MPDIPALTGLRFWAAFSIILHHLLISIVPRDTPFETMLVACGSLGMTTFFVLSGFIIHNNYHYKVSDFSIRSYWEFFVARFSRLYPLYLALLLLDVTTAERRLNWFGFTFILTFFITMTQSWIYLPGGLLPLGFHRSSVSWSVSTEMLIYAAYPALLWVLLKDRSSHTARIVWVLASILGISLALACLNTIPDMIDSLALRTFGWWARQVGEQYTFSIWLMFYSPYMRFFEFSIGALACHLFLTRRDMSPTLIERRLILFLAAASLLMVASTFFPRTSRPETLRAAFTYTGYYPWIAAMIYACARAPGSWLDRFFSLSPFVTLGEWSYSIYLFHIFLYHAVSTKSASNPSLIFTQSVLIILAVFASAYVLYTFIEMPWRKRTKAWLLAWPIGLPKASTTAS